MVQDISIKSLDEIYIISDRAIRHTDEEIREAAAKLYGEVPPSERTGPPMAVYHWETIVPDGQDVEVCVPVREGFSIEEYTARTLRHGHGFSIVAGDESSTYGELYRRILTLMVENGVHPRSQREIFHGMTGGKGTELVIVIHPWLELLEKGISDALNEEAKARILEGVEDITPLTTLENRAAWIKQVISRIENEAESPKERYDILSACADFFPEERIDAYRSVYQKRHSVDDVIEFMRKEQYWYREPTRRGSVVYVTKNPRNRKAFENAKDDEEKRSHYCHCTMIRNAMDKGISPTFCYCGTGWFKQQWEGFLGKPVEIDVETSVLNGDDTCTFAIRLPENLIREK